MKVFITGLNGFLGSEIAKHLSIDGQVSGSIRRDGSAFEERGYNIVRWELGQSFNETWLNDCDVLFHCAHDFTKDGFDMNVNGTKELHTKAVKVGVKKRIFLSSYSASADTESLYGKTKYEIEKIFCLPGDIIIRPGLVIGPGGLFFRNVNTFKKTPIIPVLSNEQYKIPFISLKTLIAAIVKILNSQDLDKQEYNLFNTELITIKDLVRQTNKTIGHKALILPLPVRMVVFLLEALKAAGISLPVDLGNLKGMMGSQRQSYKSDIDGLGVLQSNFDTAVREILF